jgi:ornithine decarboxylase
MTLRTMANNATKHAYTKNNVQPYTKVKPPLADLAFLAPAQQTPFFILDIDAVRHQLKVFEGLFPETELYYSTKTNPHPAILSLIAMSGHSFDVATIPEISLAIDHGAEPSNLLYTHPVKSVDEITEAYKLGVRKLTFDSLDELKRHVKYAPDAQNYLRISPLSNASLYNYKRKFGVSTEELIDIMDYAIKHGISIHGLSFMVGSQSMSLRPWLDMFERIIAIIDCYYETMPSLRTINIGSGFPLDYGFENVPQIEEIALAVERFRRILPADMQLIAEPGRFIAAPSTTLVTKVVQRINRQGQEWLYTDANAYSGLIEVIENGGHFPYPITSPAKTNITTSYMVAGKTLDPDDILGKAVALSDDIHPGDVLYVHDTGAYSSSFLTTYHSMPHPTLIVHDTQYTKNVGLGLNGTSINGAHAERDITAGELIFVVTGTPADARTRTTFQTDTNKHIEPNLYGAFLNHSCEPNAGIRTNDTGHLEVIAMRDITAGEDIVADYAMFEYETGSMSSVECLCGSSLCRKHITGYKDLPAKTKKAYNGFIATHLISAND